MGADDEWFPSLPMDNHLEAMMDVLYHGLAHRFAPQGKR